MNIYRPDFIVLGLVLAVGAFIARVLINLNLKFYRMVGLASWAEFWQRQLGWWLPTIRWACIFGAIGFLAIGLGIV